MFPHPSSLTAIALHILLTALASVLVITFGEHTIHRHMMHRKRLPRWVYRINPDMSAQFHNHAVMHHGTYYKDFDHEPSEEGKFFNLRILPADTLRVLIGFAPLVIALALFVSVYSAATFVLMTIAHNVLWSVVHVQMHVPEGKSFFANSNYFRFIARHHFMHHQRVGKNYNVVVPLADFVLGTATKPGIADVREMLRLGYLEPRTAGGQRALALYRQRHLASRDEAMSSSSSSARAAA